MKGEFLFLFFSFFLGYAVTNNAPGVWLKYIHFKSYTFQTEPQRGSGSLALAKLANAVTVRERRMEIQDVWCWYAIFVIATGHVQRYLHKILAKL